MIIGLSENREHAFHLAFLKISLWQRDSEHLFFNAQRIARDSYRLLHKKDGMPSATYLYNGKNNIEMGSAYLYILYYRYLKKIKDPQSRLYCAIAAYNTGAGNIAWAFTKTHNMNKAAPKINALSSDEVYEKLLKDLKYDEPKHYLKRVTKRMKVYKVAYKDLAS